MLKTNSKININNGAGFTLIEMIVVLGIFTTVVLITLALYLNITQTQKRIVSLQKIQEDVRYTMEAMAQSIRLSSINYSFYKDPNNDGDYSDAINLYPQSNSQPAILALIDQAGNDVFYGKSGYTLKFCSTNTTATCDYSNIAYWSDITPAEVNIVNLEFLITPSADPFSSPTNLPSNCSNLATPCPKGYQCQASACKYFSDGKNFQPKVRIMLSTQGASAALKERASISVQTTVTSRIANSAILNTNYDQ